MIREQMQRMVLASRPTGEPQDENFRLETVDLPEIGEGEVLVRVHYMSLDPYMRGRMDDAKSYSAAVQIGETMGGGAVGEVIASIHDCRTLITEQLIDYIRVSLAHAGGITHVKRIADLAALYHVKTGPHGATDLSPVSLGATLHFNTWVPNFGIQEYLVLGTPECDALFPSDHDVSDGQFFVSDAPGLGVDFDETEARRYDYSPGSHPVVRLTDGTVWNY